MQPFKRGCFIIYNISNDDNSINMTTVIYMKYNK